MSGRVDVVAGIVALLMIAEEGFGLVSPTLPLRTKLLSSAFPTTDKYKTLSVSLTSGGAVFGTTVGCGAREVVVVGAPPAEGPYVDKG